jgi:putative flippase GtrA
MRPAWFVNARSKIAERAHKHPLWLKLTRTPLSERFTKYSIGAMGAFVISNVTFAVFYVGGAGTTTCSVAGFLGGAIPNWAFTRRWAWKREGRPPMRTWLGYIIVSITVLVTTSVATGVADHAVRTVPQHYGLRAIIVTAVFVFVQVFWFLAKFVIFDYWVFSERSRVRAAFRSLRQVPRTARANRIP